MAINTGTDTPSVVQDEQAELFKFDEAKTKINALVSDWRIEIIKADVRRQLRRMELDVDMMRESGELQLDETMIPMRVIDDNIRKEQPNYVSFLTQSNRLISMTDVEDVSRDNSKLEMEFSKGMKYHGWELPWYREFDGAMLHGWDAVEVLLDSTKPLNVGIEHVGQDRLHFHLDLLDIQQAPYVVRKYYMSSVELQKFVKTGKFNQKQVNYLVDFMKRGRKEGTVEVFKLYFKQEGKVYVGWLALMHCEDWLAAPTPFYNGVRNKVEIPGQPTIDPLTGMMVTTPPSFNWQNVEEELYPIFILPYADTEYPRITESKGRAFLDCHKQEAHTALWTSFINALTRASGVYASPANPTGSGILKYQSDITIQSGKVFTEPINFFNFPYPDAMSILGALQYMESRNMSEINQLTESLRRKKERVTKGEVDVAREDTAMLSSVQLTLLSGHIRAVYSYVWRIVQSQALQGLIALLMVNKTGTSFVNDNALIDRVYDIRAAGDIEVVQKAQKIDKMMQMWPIIAPTPLAPVFLMDLIKLMFPERAEIYEQTLQQGDAGKNLVLQLSQVIDGLMKDHPDALAQLDQQEVQNMKLLQQAVAQYLGAGQQQTNSNQQPSA